jgi:pimeloyl-ACP methyl ester carboxylesterase
MKTQNIRVNGLNISYLEENPSGDICLLYIHGNSHNKEAFRSCVSSSLLSDYRHIALDLPGHGQSAPLARYSLPIFAEVIQAFVHSLQLKDFILVGHSLGGHVALQLTKLLRPQGLFIFGTPPAQNPLPADAFLPHPQFGCLFQSAPERAEVVRLFSSLQYGEAGLQQVIDAYWDTDPQFRSVFPLSVAAGDYEDELRILRTTEVPVHMLVCIDDLAVNADYIHRMAQDCHNPLVTTSTIHAGHAPQIQHPQLFNLALAAFTDRDATYFPYSKRESYVSNSNTHR